MLTTYGLDPGLGLLHVDERAKSGMAFDVMEPVRPVVDGWLLSVLEKRVFTADTDFWQNPRGIVRLSLGLRHEITRSLLPVITSDIGTYVERVSEMLLREALPSTLTWRRKRRAPKRAPRIQFNTHCRGCGIVIDKERTFCDDCLAEYHAERLNRFIQAGANAPRVHGGDSGRLRGERNRQHQQANAEVDADAVRARYHWPDILQSIQDVSVRTLARETGLSLYYVSLIRRGLKTPHPRHWEAFHRAGQSRPE